MPGFSQEAQATIQKRFEESRTPDPNNPPLTDPNAPPVDQVTPPDPNIPPDPATPPADPATPPIEADFISILEADKPADPATPPATYELPPEIKSQLEAANEKAKKYDDMMAIGDENPFVLMIKNRMSPEEIAKVAREMVPADYSNLSYEQLLPKDVAQELGVEGDVLANIVKEKMEAHDLLPQYDKAMAEKTLKGKYSTPGTVDSKLLNEYKKAWEENQKNIPQQPTPQQIAELQKADISAIDAELAKLEGKSWMGIVWDKTRSDAVRAMYNDKNIQPFLSDNFEFNAKGFVVKGAKDILFLDVKNAAYEQGRKDALKEVSNPDQRDRTGAPPPEDTTPLAKKMANALGFKDNRI